MWFAAPAGGRGPGADPQGQRPPRRCPAHRVDHGGLVGRRHRHQQVARLGGDPGLRHRVGLDERHRRQRPFTHDHGMHELDRDVMRVRLPLRGYHPQRGAVVKLAGQVQRCGSQVGGQTGVDEAPARLCGDCHWFRSSLRAAFTRSRVVCVASASAAHSVSARTPHAQSQCAETTSPGVRLPDQRDPALAPSDALGFGLAERQDAVGERQGTRRDHRVLVLDGLDRSPTYPAVLQHLQRGRCITIEEAHPRIDHEDVEAVVRQHALRPGQTVEQAGDLPVKGLAQFGQQGCRIDAVEFGPTDPVTAHDVSVQRVRHARRLGDGPQIRPRAVELLGVGGDFSRAVATQQHVGVGGTAIAELVGRERVAREQRMSRRKFLLV